jgi:hypothetical protein
MKNLGSTLGLAWRSLNNGLQFRRIPRSVRPKMRNFVLDKFSTSYTILGKSRYVSDNMVRES